MADDDAQVAWLDRTGFWQRFHALLQPHGLSLDLDLVVAVTEATLRAAIPEPPTVSPAGEDDPGDILVWYVEVVGRLAMVKHYVHPDDPRITVITTHPGAAGEPPWRVLESLGALPWLVENVVQVEHAPDAAAAAVVTENDYGIPIEVYRSASVADAEACHAFLEGAGNRFELGVADPEQLGRTWLVVRTGEDARLAARARARPSAEMIARTMSLRELGPTWCVEAEDDGELAALYTHGVRNGVVAPAGDGEPN